MARIAVTEEIEAIRDEEDVGPGPEAEQAAGEGEGEGEDAEAPEGKEDKQDAAGKNGKYVATMFEVHEAFDSVNTLRYSQPTHLSGSRPPMPTS